MRRERISGEPAAALFLSQSTVRSHLSAIFSEFGIHLADRTFALLRSQNAAFGEGRSWALIVRRRNTRPNRGKAVETDAA